VAVVSVLTGGAGVLAYLAAWVIIPGEGEKTSIAQNIVGKKQDAWSVRRPQDRLPAQTPIWHSPNLAPRRHRRLAV
jgi:hypothetical protein